MKNPKTLMRRYALLLAAMVLALSGVLNDFFDDGGQAQVYDAKTMDSLSSNDKLNNEHLVGKLFDSSIISVVKVIDGDSLHVYIDNTDSLRVRLYGIDAPEYEQKYGIAAKDFLSQLVNNNTIQNMEIINIDRYDRPVVVIYLANGMIVQEELLANGMAWYYERFCKIADLCSNFELLANDAKDMGLGLWADPSPEAPWDWKRN